MFSGVQDSSGTELFSDASPLHSAKVMKSGCHSAFFCNRDKVGHRFHQDYLESMAESLAVCASGGEYVLANKIVSAGKCTSALSVWLVDNSYQSRVKQILRCLGLGLNRSKTIIQWDSWRLWESWSLGAVVCNYDFAEFGRDFPVQPVPYLHYVPFDIALGFNRPKIKSLDFHQIGLEGRDWALENYSSHAQAERLLSLL